MSATPRQIVHDLLHGIRPPRPLFLPIVFSLGARLENLSLREFLANATKISNSLRQIRGHLRADGIACYFDPNLEAEALGATAEWEGDSVRRLNWANAARNGGAPALRPAEVAAKSGRVAIAIDVIKRLNALVRDGTVLMAGVTGPFTLAAKIMQRGDAEAEIPSEVLEHAASVTTAVASAFAEAGAIVIFIREETGCPTSRDFREVETKPSDSRDMRPAPPLRSLQGRDHDHFETWLSLLAPTFNVVRFYQALPVLQFANKNSVEQNRDLIIQHAWDCVVSVPIDCDLADLNALGLGLALPATEDIDGQAVAAAVAERHPVLITTTDDLPPSTDVKRLTKVLEEVQR